MMSRYEKEQEAQRRRKEILAEERRKRDLAVAKRRSREMAKNYSLDLDELQKKDPEIKKYRASDEYQQNHRKPKVEKRSKK